jgi:hypothetical protein
MRAEVAEIARLAGSARVTSRGLTRDVSVDHAVSEQKEAGGSPGAPPAIADPAGADPGTDPGADGPMNEQVRQTLRDLAAPMPEEAVGVGARWRKNSVVDTRSARIAQTETFRLVDLHGDRGSLDDVLAQHGPPAAEGTVERENGADPARIESILASGDAKVRFDLSRLVPQTLFDGTTSLTVSGPSPGAAASARAMTMIMHVAIAGTRP